MRVGCGLLVIGWLVASSDVSASRPEPPCVGCTLDVPDAKGPLPLLVVLHGDRQPARAAAVRWRAAAAQRGWVVLALQCPETEGCKASWWRWNGDVRWVKDQVVKLAGQLAIDPTRTYLAGWSGGATYLTMHVQAWTDTFAAVVIHGGGRAPSDGACPSRRLPGYFLVGNRNPLHELALGARGYFARCNQDVVWDLVTGGDHDAEARALDARKAAAILDWLVGRAGP